MEQINLDTLRQDLHHYHIAVLDMITCNAYKILMYNGHYDYKTHFLRYGNG